MIASIIIIAILVITLAGIWQTFVKAGESGWKALIPVYNIYVMLRIGGHSGWWVLTFLLPLISWLIGILGATANAQTTSTMESTTSLPVGQLNVSPDQIFGIGGVLAAVIITTIVLLVFAFFQLVVLVSIVMTYDLARSFGKGMAFTWGLLVLPVVFWPILGFGEAEYRGPVSHPNMVDSGSGAHIAQNNQVENRQTAQEETEGNSGDPFME